MKITLVRHGQTESNYLEMCQGISNDLLNDTGRRECQRLREKLKDKHFDVCYMSPLIRAVESAMILIGDRVEMIPDKRLIDRDLGEFEGKNRNLYIICLIHYGHHISPLPNYYIIIKNPFHCVV